MLSLLSVFHVHSLQRTDVFAKHSLNWNIHPSKWKNVFWKYKLLLSPHRLPFRPFITPLKIFFQYHHLATQSEGFSRNVHIFEFRSLPRRGREAKMGSSAAGPTETGHPLTINNQESQSWRCLRWSATAARGSLWALGLVGMRGTTWRRSAGESARDLRESQGEQSECSADGCVGKLKWPTGASKHSLQRGPHRHQLLRWFGLLNSQLYSIAQPAFKLCWD